MRTEFVVFDGFDLLDVFGPLEVLAAAGWEVELVHLDGPRTVTSAQGVRVEATARLGADTADGAVVPGGGWLNRAPMGAWTEVQEGRLPRALAEHHGHVSWTASVCSGAMVLAAAGLLRGRRATTNAACIEDLRPHAGEVVHARVVDDGDIVTAGALSCGLDLGLHLVARTAGADEARGVGRRLAYPPDGADRA